MQDAARDGLTILCFANAHVQTRVTRCASSFEATASKSIVASGRIAAVTGREMANAAALKTASSGAGADVSGAVTPTLFAWAMLSDPGRVRHANQDACAAASEHAAFVVCDGVGGAAGGEVASRLAADTFLAALKQSGADMQSSGRAANADDDSPHHPAARLQQAVVAANAVVFERAQKNRALRGMATTLVAALLEYGGADAAEGCPTLWLAHAGDSRAYVLRGGANGTAAELVQLTRDHSLVEEQIRAGLLNAFDATRSPVRNVITRAVGAMPAVEPEIASHAIRPGDLYLLASDGLTRELEDDAIARILAEMLGGDSARTSAKLEGAARALIDAANEHGGRDNITVLLIACQ